MMHFKEVKNCPTRSGKNVNNQENASPIGRGTKSNLQKKSHL